MSYVIYNDFHLLPIYALGLFLYVVTLAAMIYYHEVGHEIYLTKKKIRYKTSWVKWGRTITTESEMTDAENLRALLWGVFVGLIPLLSILHFFEAAFLLVIPYALMLRHDFKEIAGLYAKLNPDDDAEDISLGD